MCLYCVSLPCVVGKQGQDPCKVLKIHHGGCHIRCGSRLAQRLGQAGGVGKREGWFVQGG